MSKLKIKKSNISGFRVAVMIISVLLLSVIMAFSMLWGISSFKQHGPVVIGDVTTYRKKPPQDGSLPTTAKPIDNIGYMAYVLDHQQMYHVYAHNSTKCTGYEQVTQSWKDFKTSELSGEDFDVMVSSDLSYSGLVKSSSQSCFIDDDEAHVRGGNKPAKNSVPLDIEWSNGKPTVYNSETYKKDYGEFNKEISVYVINEQTLIGADDVIDNGDGTYTQKYYLNEGAGCWYQYGMKTRGGLKGFPVFKKIEITFTFDAQWQVLESYCDEKATINPRALGGLDMSSNSKTTTTFDYTTEGFDEAHFAYYKDYFKNYVGSLPDDSTGDEVPPTVIDILGGGFNKVLSQSGQQFDISLTAGSTEYDGKVYLKIADLSDVLASLDARVALEKKGSGKQDLYIEFKGGAVNVYYSTDFALTVDINEISQSLNKITDWVNGLTSRPVSVEDGDGGDFGSVLNDLKLQLSDTEAIVTLKSDDLLGLGIGVDAAIGFSRTREEDGDIYDVKSLNLNCVKLNGTVLDLSADIVPDVGSQIISRNPVNTPANLSDYIDSVYNILSSNSVKIGINADGLIEGLSLNADAYLSIASSVAANVQISAEYKGVSLTLDASYINNLLYLHITEINGLTVDAKVYCDVADTFSTVKDIVSLFAPSVAKEASTDRLADIINKVLNLDFSNIIGKVSGNADEISLEINADNLLDGLGISTGFGLGTVSLRFDRANEVIYGSFKGVELAITGSDVTAPIIAPDGFVNFNAYLDSVYSLLSKPSYNISFTLNGTEISDKIDLRGLKAEGVATVAAEGNCVRVQLPLTVSYGEYGVELTAYYTVNLSDGSYGKVYINVTSLTVLNEKIQLDAKVHCDVAAAVDGIKEIINKFLPSSEAVGEQTVQVDMLAKVIQVLLKLDYNEIIFATNEKLCVTLNVDELLSSLDISLGVTFGELDLQFIVASATLNGRLEQLGLEVTLNGNDGALAEFELSNYVDLQIYLDGVNTLLGKNSYDLELSFTGNDFIKSDVDLTGLELGLSAKLAFIDDFNGLEVNFNEINLSYNGLALKLSAHYEVGFDGGYGTVYLDVSGINEAPLAAKLYLEIDEVAEGVNSIINAVTPLNYSLNSDVIGKLLQGVLKLDFTQFFCVTDEKATVKLDLDALLSGFNLGIKLGVLNAEYNPAKCEIIASDSQIGLNLLKLNGSDEKLKPFVGEGYFNVAELIDLIGGAIEQGKAIAEAQDVAFRAEASGTVNGTAFAVTGVGEVAWAQNNVKVALSLSVAVDVYNLSVNFIYDQTSEPFVTLTINEVGVRVNSSEIDKLVNSFKGLLGQVGVAGYSVGGYTVEEILSNANVRAILSAILDVANDLVIEMQTDAEQAIYNLVIKHADGISFIFGANGGLSLEIMGGSFNAVVTAEAGSGATVADIYAELATENYTYYGLSEFLRIIYSDFFDAFEQVSLKNILGDNPYKVNIQIVGAHSGIDVLEGVTVKAGLYYDEGFVGANRTAKLVKTDLDIDLSGTAVNVSVAYSGRMIFVELNKIGATKLSGIKFKADVMNVYDAAEQLVRIITDTNLVEFLTKHLGDSENVAQFASMTDKNGTRASDKLSQLLGAILSLDIENSFVFDKETGRAKINIDPVTNALFGVEFGTLNATLNQQNKTLFGTLETDGGVWLTLDAKPCDFDNGALNSDGYIDIGFASMLLDDVTKTVLNDSKQVYGLYTFTGSIKIDIDVLIKLSIEFKNVTLTAGFDANNKFYITFGAEMQSSAATDRCDIGVTYSDGLLVFGRNITSTPGNSTSTPEYKVFTLEYLLDNLLDKNTSPVKWLLGTSDFTWGILASIVKTDINSGLTKPQTYNLFEQLQQTVKDSEFKLSDYISGMSVNSGDGQILSSYGNGAQFALNNISLDSGYYAFDINASKLTNGVLTGLGAAILRDENGLKGIKAFAQIDSMVKINVDLSTYLKGMTDVYGSNESDKFGTVALPNYLDVVTRDFGFDRNHRFTGDKQHITPIFGCYNSIGNEYISSDVLETVYLDVYAKIGDTVPEKTLNVLYGSTINLIRSDFPEFADEDKTLKLIYVGADGNVLPDSIIITDEWLNYIDGKGRLSIYKSSEPAVEVVFNFVGIGVMNSQSVALSIGDALAEYELNNYSWLGWYKEASFENRVEFVDEADIVDGKLNVYGKYVKSFYGAENGIDYSFDVKADGYFVSGVNDNISYYYNNADAWLEVAAEINGYPVRYIGREAFKNHNDNIENSLVNVIVPDTVVAVYDLAFVGNKGIKNVVFCAESVFFGGRADSGNKTTVFYGCYPADAADNNDCTVYYNGIRNNPFEHVPTTDNQVDSSWNRIYYDKPFISEKIYYVKAQLGGWEFVNYAVEGCDFAAVDFGFVSGIKNSVSGDDYADYIKNSIISQLNDNSSAYGIIYEYSVSVSENRQNGVRVITITITDNSLNAWHVLAMGEGVEFIANGDIQLVNGQYYARPDAEITVRCLSGNEGISRLTVYGESGEVIYDSGIIGVAETFTYTMPDSYALITAECVHLPITEITLKSAVAFDGVYEKTLSVNEGDALPAIYADGYTLLGWAYENSSNLLEFETTVQHRAYYAVWARNREEVTSVSLQDGAFTAQHDLTKANSIYGWYAYEEVDGKASFQTPVTPATLTVNTTVIYARMVYAVNYSLTSNLSGSNKFYVNPTNVENEANAQGAFLVLEDTALQFNWANDGDVNKVLQVTYVNEAAQTSTLFFRIKNKRPTSITEWVTSWQTASVSVNCDGLTNGDISTDKNDNATLLANSNKTLNISAV